MLPYGVQSNIAKTLNISRISVSKYFACKSNSFRIEKEAVRLYEIYKAEFEQLKTIVNG